MRKYNKELKKILADEGLPLATVMTRDEVEVEIAKISDLLKCPLSNTERLLLVSDRQDLRKILGALK